MTAGILPVEEDNDWIPSINESPPPVPPKKMDLIGAAGNEKVPPWVTTEPEAPALPPKPMNRYVYSLRRNVIDVNLLCF